MLLASLSIVILTGATDLPYHDWKVLAPRLQQILQQTGHFGVTVNTEPSRMNRAALKPHRAAVLLYNGPRWGPEAEAALEQFVRNGRGLVAVHGVSYGPFYGQDMKTRKPAGEPWAEYARMMGATWKLENVGHSLRHVFQVKWADPAHPIARGMPPFEADDELYHKIDLLPGAHVVAAAFSDPQQKGTGRSEPMIWTVAYGRGRVVHIMLGHDLKSMSQPGFASAFARSVEWAATGKVKGGRP